MAAIAVGTHYFGFRTAYGDWTNWVLGGMMSLVGVGTIFFNAPNANIVPYVIATIEIAFGCWFTWNSIWEERLNSLTNH